MRPARWLLLLGLSAFSVTPAAAQAPPTAVWVQGLPIGFDECKSRVSRALTAEGYGGWRDFGNGWIGFTADRSATVGCIHGRDETVLVISVAGEDQTAAANRLLALVRGGNGPAAQAGVIRKAPNAEFCLNLHENNGSDGATINLWRCSGHASQQWRAQSDGTIRHGAFPDRCLNLHHHENRDGAVVNLWSCNGHDSQKWRVSSDMTIRQTAFADKCLNLHQNVLQDGAMVNLWTCNGHDSQRWSVAR